MIVRLAQVRRATEGDDDGFQYVGGEGFAVEDGSGG